MPELDRRDFLKVVGLSAGAAATAACQEPVEKVIPYLVQPEEVIPGIPTYYASTCRECPAACATIVKTREGRPIKVDSNPDDVLGGNGLCVRGQASLHRTYDAARFRGPMWRDGDRLVPLPWEQAIAFLVEQLRPAAAAGRAAFLGGNETGTLDALIDQFMAAIGSPHRVRYEAYAHEALREANRRLFGVEAVPHFDLAAADVVVAFGTDFLETWLAAPRNQQGWAASRAGGKGYGAWVGPRLSLSGANMDEWIAPRPGSELFLALALAERVARAKGSPLAPALAPWAPAQVAERIEVPAERVEALAERLAVAQAPLALPPGQELQGSNATAFAAAVQLLNFVSGAVGRTVRFGPDHNVERLARFGDLRELAGRMRGGEVSVLLVHDTNPAYSVPTAFGFAEALAQVPFVVSFSSASDETTALANLVLPDHTPFEAWGDAEPVRGLRRLQQPTVRPLLDTRAIGDVLLQAGRALGAAERLPAGSFRDLLAQRWGGAPALDLALGTGGAGAPAATRPVTLQADPATLGFDEAQLGGEGELVLLAYPSLHFYDGRSARFGELQQIPDPVTKTAWGSYAELHPDTAAQLGVSRGDVIRIRTESGEISLPAFPHDALRPGVVAVAVGQGHQPVDPAAELLFDRSDWTLLHRPRGVNVLGILPGRLDPSSGGLAWLSARVRVEPTGETFRVVSTQATFDEEARGFTQSTTLAALAGREEAPHEKPELHSTPYDPAADPATVQSPYRWGMSIDLDACTGCNACVAACSSENNGQVVGEDLLRVGREMSWIRLNRFLTGSGEGLEVRHAPMLCQHCGSAPCENVCPVLATYHSQEGLNIMVYNRCIGTRYCNNNCPYKVRRFNYLPYDFYVREPEHLRFNPDVTVRSKGVMEKCNFCVQRINYAKDEAMVAKRELSEGTVKTVYEKPDVRDGEVETACQQACPSNAIVFGNFKDPASRVSALYRDPRRFVVLEHLNTRPAVIYLKSIRRRPAAAEEGPDEGHHA